jgi:predicted PurR-regulated permease PerM
MGGEDYLGAMPPMVPSPTPGPPKNAVPVRQVLGIIGLVLAAGAAVELVIKLERIISWLAIAGFFAVVLTGPVNFLQRRLHLPRAVAAVVVFLLGIAIVAAAIYSFVRPLVDQANQFINHLPGYVEDAKAGRGTVGRLVQRYNLDEWVQRNQDDLRKAAQNAGRPALKVAQSVASGLAALVTILVLTFLMLLEGPDMMRGGLNMLSPPLAERIRRVTRDCARAMSGYVAGNLLISVIAAFVTFVSLEILGVPFALVLAIWVAFADLIPLVGATLGAIPTILVALLHSLAAGIIMLVIFIVYQQFENHVLQVTIMSRTVKLNPLIVLVSVLIGVELYGFLGALLAIPAAGVIQVISRDIYEDYRRRKLVEGGEVGPEDLPVQVITEDPNLPPTREAS